MKAFFKDFIYTIKRLNLMRSNLIEAWPHSYYRRETIVERFLGKRIFILNKPEDVQHVMVSNASNYRKSMANRKSLGPLLGQGVFVSEGKLWSRQRKIMTPATNTKRLEGYAATMVDAASKKVADWREKSLGKEINVSEEMTILTADIITRCMFGCELGAKGVTLYQAFMEYLASHGRIHITELIGLPQWLPRPGQRRGKEAVKKFDSIIHFIIETRLKSTEEHNDLLQMLLDFHDSSGQPMTRELVRDEVASIYLAGHETTAITLTWAFYLLHEHPDIKRRLHEEIESVVADRVPSFSDLPKLKLCRAIIDETLRMFPPVHVFSRQALEDDQISGHKVPKGSFMTISSWILHRHKLLWDEPNEFRPERFLPENSSKVAPYSYIPFGAGPRVCLGKHFGLTEAVLLLAIFAQNFDLEVKPDHVVEPCGRMTLRPKEDLPMIVHDRAEVAETV